MMVAAVVAALDHRRAAELAAPDRPACRRAGPRCFRSLISAAQAWSVSLQFFLRSCDQVAVLVPGFVEELHEAHAALDQPAGQQAVVGERRLARLGAVHLEDVLRLAGDVHQLRARWSACGRPSRRS